MIAFELQGAWWKATDLNWALICHLKRIDNDPVELVGIADKLSGPPGVTMHSIAVYYNTDNWKKKQWRRTYRKIPAQLRNTFEKNLRTIAEKKKPAFKPFLLRRVRKNK